MLIGSKVFKIFIANMIIFLSSVGVYGQPLGITSQQSKQEIQQVLSCENGRYVFGQISDSSSDQFMLDTLTGRLWQIAESGSVGLYLREVPYRTGRDTYSPIPGEVTRKPEEESKE